MKQCRKCLNWKDEEEFNWRYKVLGVRQPVCKDCSRERSRKHYAAYREEESAKKQDQVQKRREEAQRFIYDYLSHKVCVDCGEYDFAVLTFDHVRGKKKMDVTRMMAGGYSIEAIRAEIELCEVVCSNCHMRREQRRRHGLVQVAHQVLGAGEEGKVNPDQVDLRLSKYPCRYKGIPWQMYKA